MDRSLEAATEAVLALLPSIAASKGNESWQDNAFGNLLISLGASHTRSSMSFLPPHREKQRSPRLRLADTTPAVLRLQNGWRVPGNLQVISLTGGLLCLSKPLSEGCQVKVMFVTDKGPVLGAAEMLSAENGGMQPFRFTTLCADDRTRLQAVIQASTERNRDYYQQIEKYRAW